MTWTVRIYGNHPHAGPNALLSEHEFTSGVEALQFTAAAIGVPGWAVELAADTRQ